MEVNRGIWRTLSVFYRLARGWLFRVWILSMLAGVIPLGLALFGITDPEREFWWIGLGFGLVVLPIVGFHLVRIERDELAAKLDPKSFDLVLSPLIAEGAAIRIVGKAFLSEESVNRWVDESAKPWTKKTLNALKEFYPDAAPNFETLHNVTAQLPAGYVPFNGLHRLHLRMLTQRVDYLKNLTRRES